MTYKALLSFLGLLIYLNAYFFPASGLAWLIVTIYLLLTAWLIGGRIAKSVSSRLTWGNLIIVCLIILVGSLAFYTNWFGQIVSLILLLIMPWLGLDTQSESKLLTLNYNWRKTIQQNWWLLLPYLAGSLVTLELLLSSATNEAIRSPWQITSPWLFVSYVATAAWAGLVSQRLNSWYLIPFYLVSLTVLPLVLPLGYGFDSFIHQATTKLLQTYHTITPKPWYYVGQYSLEVILSDWLKISLKQIDLFLLPVLVGLTLPVVIKKLNNLPEQTTGWLYLLPLIITLPAFTYTTPLNLAYYLALLVIISLTNKTLPRWLPWLFTMAALVTHPIIGLPLIGLVTYQQANNWPALANKLRLLSLIGTALIIPIAFLVLNQLNPNLLAIVLVNPLNGLKDLLANIYLHLPRLNYATNLLDSVYLWGWPLLTLICGLAALGFYSVRQTATAHWLKLAGALVFSYLLLKLFCHFDALPDNEQDFYNLRLWELALFSLWPLLWSGANKIADYLKQKNTSQLGLTVALALLITAGFYLSYPRFDLYHHDTAYNTTAYDVAAVRLINSLEPDNNYVVLANQAVSAAAVQEFGFSVYHHGNYFYPLPTGTNPLYQVYLQATQTGLPERPVLAQAADLSAQTHVYLVLNNYWANFDKLTAMADQMADQQWTVGNGRIKVYLYDFTEK